MIAPSSRLLAALTTWALLFLASPGILGRDGAGVLALFALVPWAISCSRPGPKAFLVEWLAAGIGSAALSVWLWYVWPGTMLILLLVPGFYMACAGALLRLLARRYPLAIAAPVAWVGLETLRYLVVPPLGFGWLRLGTCFHATPWLAGSARIWGTGGLSFVAAAFAGGVADFLRPRGRQSRRAAWGRWAQVFGGLPLGSAVALSFLTAAPPTRPGPRVLLVQPAFEQRRKMEPPDWQVLGRESCDLTAKGLEQAGDPPPDLVAWGETMFPYPLAEKGLAEAFDRGARSPDWARDRLSREWIESMDAVEATWIRTKILGPRGILPAGTSFLAGAEYHALQGREIRRQNAVILWTPAGERAGLSGKVHLVPGAEELCGAERLGFVRDFVESIAGYVPDLLAFDRVGVLDLRIRDGRSFRFAASVCFDNAFEDPYTSPLREGDLDFHLVCSNEAWYERSFEYDQMVAFSRLIAIGTGRSVVRSTNGGISLVLDPAGRDVARLRVGGEDRMVTGTLCAAVPVPAPGAGSARTAFVRFEKGWLALWLGLPCLLAFFVVRGGYTTFERS
jgi:apolipoprotein N-acyltransferase